MSASTDAVVTSRLDPAAAPSGWITLFCPCLEGLPASNAAAVSILPIHDANGQLLALSGALRDRGDDLFSCVFAADPFRSIEHLLSKLISAGVKGVANFPTVGILDEEMLTSLDRLGMGADKEVELIRRANVLGLRTAAIASSERAGEDFVAAGANMLILPPWLSARTSREMLHAFGGRDVKILGLVIQP